MALVYGVKVWKGGIVKGEEVDDIFEGGVWWKLMFPQA